MDYDEIMADLTSLSPHWEKTLETLYNEIGYELVENIFKPFYEYILPHHDAMMAESFLKSIEVIASKIYLYREAYHSDTYITRLEKVCRTDKQSRIST